MPARTPTSTVSRQSAEPQQARRTESSRGCASGHVALRVDRVGVVRLRRVLLLSGRDVRSNERIRLRTRDVWNHDGCVLTVARHGAPKQILESPDIAAIAPMSSPARAA